MYKSAYRECLAEAYPKENDIYKYVVVELNFVHRSDLFYTEILFFWKVNIRKSVNFEEKCL